MQSEYEAAEQESSVAVELNPSYIKALMRRCQAQEHMDKLEEALAGEQGRVLYVERCVAGDKMPA